MKEIRLHLTVEEVNLILDSLGDRPYKSVFGVINKIQEQAAAQFRENDQRSKTPVNAPDNNSETKT